MSKTAHTPGPWRAGTSTFFAGLDGPACMRVYTDYPPTEFELTGDNLAANAHLIAAAPDLVEASTPFVAAAKSRSVDAPEWRDTDTVSIVVTVGDLRAIAAASTKAKGGAE